MTNGLVDTKAFEMGIVYMSWMTLLNCSISRSMEELADPSTTSLLTKSCIDSCCLISW